MGNVIKLFEEDTADSLLDHCKGKFDKVMVFGEKNGRLEFNGNGELNISQLVFWIESVKLELMLRNRED